MADQAAHMHLAELEALCDLRLSHAMPEAQDENGATTVVQLGKGTANALLVDDPVERGVGASQFDAVAELAVGIDAGDAEAVDEFESGDDVFIGQADMGGDLGNGRRPLELL